MVFSAATKNLFIGFLLASSTLSVYARHQIRVDGIGQINAIISNARINDFVNPNGFKSKELKLLKKDAKEALKISRQGLFSGASFLGIGAATFLVAPQYTPANIPGKELGLGIAVATGLCFAMSLTGAKIVLFAKGLTEAKLIKRYNQMAPFAPMVRNMRPTTPVNYEGARAAIEGGFMLVDAWGKHYDDKRAINEAKKRSLREEAARRRAANQDANLPFGTEVSEDEIPVALPVDDFENAQLGIIIESPETRQYPQPSAPTLAEIYSHDDRR